MSKLYLNIGSPRAVRELGDLQIREIGLNNDNQDRQEWRNQLLAMRYWLATAEASDAIPEVILDTMVELLEDEVAMRREEEAEETALLAEADKYEWILSTIKEEV